MRELSWLNFQRYLPSKCWNSNQHNLSLEPLFLTMMLSYHCAYRQRAKAMSLDWVSDCHLSTKNQATDLLSIFLQLNRWHLSLKYCFLQTYWILHMQQFLSLSFSVNLPYVFFKCYFWTFIIFNSLQNVLT